MPFACIFVPDFPVEALLRAEPELRLQALAVLEGKAPLQTVFAANENARRAGVSPGMTKPQVEACSGLVLRARSLLQESAAHATLLDCAQSFSPRVEDAGGETIVLDLAGLQSLFGPLPKIARALTRRASDLGLEANVAVASNPDTAVLAARGFSGITVIAEGKEAEFLGRLPVEVLLENAAGEQSSEQLLETFHRWGIRHLRDLTALPDVALSERLGQRGIHLQKLARGATSRNLVPVEPPLSFEETIELEYPVVLLEPLAFLLGRLLEQICVRLSARSLATQELRLELELENWCEERMLASHLLRSCPRQDRGAVSRPDPLGKLGAGSSLRAKNALAQDDKSIFQRTLRLPVPLLDPKTFLKLLQLDLKAHPPGAPIVKIHLRVEPARPRAAQIGLFLPPSPEPEKLELTLARIAGIVGEDKVGSLELLDTHRPEGFRMQCFAPAAFQELKNRGKGGKEESSRAVARSGNSRTKDLPAQLKSYPPLNTEPGFCSGLLIPSAAQIQNLDAPCDLVTALRIFRPPIGVTVTMQEGKPVCLGSSRRKELQGEILWAAGPWRSTGDWWEQEGWARDEWDIAVQEETNIALYRLVRDLLSGRWFVEGAYD